MPAFSSPKVVEPAMSDSPYVPGSDTNTTRTHNDVRCLDSGEDLAPTTCNDAASAEWREKLRGMSACVQK